jgi:tetraacyldisaccharide-1-P 4'-kinase
VKDDNDQDFHNKHFEVPHTVSSVFTGREDVYQRLSEACLPSNAREGQRVQKRFVLYGLGGSGKTQICLKFAQDHRERQVAMK